MTSRDDILQVFDRMNVWSRGSERAPHKPLLVLYALAQFSRAGPGSIAYREAAPRITGMLQEFGPSRKSYHPEHPFWRLQNDGVWIVDNAAQFTPRSGQSHIPNNELLEGDAHARFTAEITTQLTGDPSLITDIAFRLLDAHFPASIHQDIGLDLSLRETVTRSKRDPAFRSRILTAYGDACAVCGFDVRIGNQVMCLDAAHIQWHQAGGPDTEQNGLALCSIHHKAFDKGAFTVCRDRLLLVSERAQGRCGLDEWLLKFHGRPVRLPQSESFAPAGAYLDWHEREVFKRPSRESKLRC